MYLAALNLLLNAFGNLSVFFLKELSISTSLSIYSLALKLENHLPPALSNAYDEREKSEPQLCMLLVRLYYLAAKMKMNDKDLNGHFVKIS